MKTLGPTCRCTFNDDGGSFCLCIDYILGISNFAANYQYPAVPKPDPDWLEAFKKIVKEPNPSHAEIRYQLSLFPPRIDLCIFYMSLALPNRPNLIKIVKDLISVSKNHFRFATIRHIRSTKRDLIKWRLQLYKCHFLINAGIVMTNTMWPVYIMVSYVRGFPFSLAITMTIQS